MTAREVRVLRTHVWVDGKVYEGGTVPPADVAERITNPKAWTVQQVPGQPEPTGEGGPSKPAELVSGEDGGEFDPFDHTVEDVKAYLAEADEAERERVLAAERAGKGRTTLIG